MSEVEESGHKTFDPAANATAYVARTRSEAATLVFAVAVAVTLGIACGVWINSRLTPRSSAGAARSARPLPDARTATPPMPEARPSPCDGCDAPSAGEATSARSDKAAEARPKTDTGTQTDAARETGPGARATPGRPDEVAAVGAAPRVPTDSEAVAATSPDPSRPLAWQVGAVPKAGARAAARGKVEGGAAQGPRGPCALYASASSLRVRVGGAAPLILGGPGAGVRINVSTPDWAELAVIFEGPAAGHNGWLRYSVRSVGRRPGLYTVRVSSPCGSQTIPVTVK
ncbi:MAG TPA: hypothetical protein VF297_23155 [Pyrinomonadaceae bacterium]